MYDDLKTNSGKQILTAVRHCRKVYWYINALHNYVQITKTSLRDAITEEHLKNKMFHLTWDEDVLFIREEE